MFWVGLDTGSGEPKWYFTVWDKTFPSDQEALSVALDGIKAAGGIQAFSELSDLEAKNHIFPESLTRH